MLLKNEAKLPLAPDQLDKVTQVIQELNPQQVMWVSGYLAALSLNDKPLKISNKAHSQLTILYASQTGNGKLLAENYALACQSQGINYQLISLGDYKPRNIAKEKYVVFIVSTHGEGDAPDDAEIFYDYIFSPKKPELKNLKYSLLSLGDSSYEQFCQTGIDIDLQLQKLGAHSVIDRIDCDLDYKEASLNWQNKTSKYFAQYLHDTDAKASPLSLLKPQQNFINRDNTFSAEILTIQKITTQASVKNIYHIELNIENSNLNYDAGDSLGVVSLNNTKTVKTVIESSGFDSNKIVQYKNKPIEFSEILKSLELTLISKSFLKFYAQLSESNTLAKIVADHQLFIKYVSERQISDLLSEFPTHISEQQLVENLFKISPRLYSIASSFKTHSEEVHLTVSLVKSTAHKPNNGLVSGFLCDHATEGDNVEIYIEKNNHFKLPENNETPIIMVSAGTGIAPYRGFLQERQSLNATGKNWLFFGNPSFENDFLYQIELQKFYNENLLTKIDLAFSRDQKHKIYVQDKIKQNAKEIWLWLQQGAHFYICGNKDNMAKAVENALLSLIQKHGHKTTEEAIHYLKTLKQDRRYQKDVY